MTLINQNKKDENKMKNTNIMVAIKISVLRRRKKINLVCGLQNGTE